MAKRQIWESPVLHFEGDRAEHRSVTWLELFFDLFFVVSIAQVTHELSAHPSWAGMGHFILLFIPIWWVWIGFTYYNERFESQGLENRIFTFVLMLPIIGLAVFAHGAFGENFKAFVLSYVAAQVIINILWLRATLHVPAFRPVGIRFTTGFTLAIILGFIAAFVGGTWGFVLFGLSMTLNLLTPFTTVAQQAQLPQFSTSKLPERFGLFMIIVLGEMVVGVVNGVASLEAFTPALFITAILGVALGFGLWWIYFDFVARRPPRSSGFIFAWSYLHLPLAGAIAATGGAIAAMLAYGNHVPEVIQQLTATSVAGALIVIALLELTLRRAADEPTHRFLSPSLKVLGGLLALAIGWLMPIHDPIVLMGLLLTTLLMQMVYAGWVWFTQDLDDPQFGGGELTLDFKEEE